jgi:hypothetical protein
MWQVAIQLEEIRERGNMALKSVETQNVEFKSNCCEGYNAV